MLAAERQAKIIAMIQSKGSALVEELAKELKVSPMTIRRDLVKLEADNQVERCHGGAVAAQEVTYADKQTSYQQEKKNIALVCEHFVSEGDMVFLDAGTTTFEIAKRIKDIPRLVVVTNDLEIAHFLISSPAELILCGGAVQKSTGSMFGYYATQMLQDFQFDAGFFGAACIDEEFQVLTPTIDKAFLKRETARQCKRSYLVVDASKFQKQSMTKINHLGDYTAVVTNYRFQIAEREKLDKLGASLIEI